MRRIVRDILCALALLSGLAAGSAHAQAPVGYDSLSAPAVAESLKVLTRLIKDVPENSKDVAGLFHKGLLAFALAERAYEPNPPPGLDRRELRLMAGAALNRVVDLAPDVPMHWIWLGRYHAVGGGPLDHARATEMFKRAFSLFEAKADSANLLELLLTVAANQFHFYNKFETRAIDPLAELKPEKEANTPRPDTPHEIPGVNNPVGTRTAQRPSSMPTGHPPAVSEPMKPLGVNEPPGFAPLLSVSAAAGADTSASLPRILGRATNQVLEKYGIPKESDFDAKGEDHYLFAQQYYQRAYALAPRDDRTFRGLARVYVARDRWEPLGELARDHVRRVAADAWGWMAVGLSEQRMKAQVRAAAAFDSGLARMSPDVRGRLLRLDRVLRPSDSLIYSRSDSMTRAKETAFYWTLARPLWSVAEESPHIEFYARVTYAELRWGVPERRMLGADNARGQIYVRYGPANLKQSDFWMYNSGLIFGFVRGTPQTGPLAPADFGLNKRVREWQPSRWDNIAETKIDSMPTQVARFRATRDSVDVFVATRAPMEALAAVSPKDASWFTNFWLSSLTSPAAYTDSIPLSGSGAMEWTKRVPAGKYYYRIESIVPNALGAGRAADFVTMDNDTTTGFSLRGFGMSDVLVGSRLLSPDAPARWSDVDITPVLGGIARAGELSLVWENYELARNADAARYRVTIALQHDVAAPTAAGRIVAQIASGIAGAIGFSRKEAAGGVTFQFTRDVRYAPAVVDRVTLALGATPPGDYHLRIEVQDQFSGRTTARTFPLTIRE